MQKLDTIEIAYYCAEQLKKVFNEDFDVIEDNILAKVQDIILNSHNGNYDILYDFYDSVYPVLENIRKLNLQQIELTDGRVVRVRL